MEGLERRPAAARRPRAAAASACACTASTRRSSARCATGKPTRSWRRDSVGRHGRGRVSIEIAATAGGGLGRSRWIPSACSDWVTIHRSLGRHGDGRGARAGYEMTQTLTLRGAPFKVHWRARDVRGAAPRRLARARPGRVARRDVLPPGADRRRDVFRLPQRVPRAARRARPCRPACRRRRHSAHEALKSLSDSRSSARTRQMTLVSSNGCATITEM